eukprot:scaffold18980_cov63-Phaeocystis_antarctica.AAC.1
MSTSHNTVDDEPANALPTLPLRHGRAVVKESIVLDGDLEGRVSGSLHREAIDATVEDRVVRKVEGPRVIGRAGEGHTLPIDDVVLVLVPIIRNHTIRNGAGHVVHIVEGDEVAVAVDDVVGHNVFRAQGDFVMAEGKRDGRGRARRPPCVAVYEVRLDHDIGGLLHVHGCRWAVMDRQVAEGQAARGEYTKADPVEVGVGFTRTVMSDIRPDATLLRVAVGMHVLSTAARISASGPNPVLCRLRAGDGESRACYVEVRERDVV